MKKSVINKLLLSVTLLIMMLTSASPVKAQKVADKELVGVWLMESMQWEGESKTMCGKDYTQVKVYRANGEYACAEIAKNNNKYIVLPHEYGTYTFKNGKYTEMGRNGILKLVSKDTFTGQWKTRHDVWKKKAMPAKLVDYIVMCCKTKEGTKEMQDLIKKYCFK